MKKFSVSKMLLALSAIALVPSACQQDEMPETVGGLPEDGVTFQWNEVDSRTVTVEASAEWSYEEIDEDDIIDVDRPEGTNELVITPKGMNYSLDTHSATVRIVVGSGSTAVESSISVSQGANTKTYLTFLDEDLSGDNPIIQFPSALGGEPAVREILISTNNVLSVDVSSNQDIDITTGTEGSEEAMTKVQLPGEYGWMSYEISQRETDEGVISVLTLTSQVNQSLTETLTVAIDVVSGSEDINNEVVTRRIALVSLPSTPAIVINPSDLVFAYDAAEAQTVSVISNVPYAIDASWQAGTGTWSEYPEIELVEEGDLVNVYSVKVPEYALAEDRVARIGFMQSDAAVGEGLAAQLEVRQTAAPKATVRLSETAIVVGNDRTNATLSVETSMPQLMTIECTDDDGQKADWFSAEYDAELGNTIAITFEQPGQEERNGTLTVTVGSGMNTATASVDIRQLSTQPSVALNPATVTLNQAGDPVVVEVVTNQETWSIDRPESSDFTIVEDHENNTITVSGTEITSGSRTASYTVTAGEATATLEVSQSISYKVGDPYVVNGKTVGIVYEVDPDGIHGKAFSLTVDNLNERVFFAEAGWLPENDYRAQINENARPLSLTDGKANCERMKNEPDWENKFQNLKWVEDLGESQGVDWYIPAIDELKSLLEYMSGAAFTDVHYPLEDDQGNVFEYDLEAMDRSSSTTIESSWKSIRELYSQYTGTGSGYETEQYVVFDPDADCRNSVGDPYMEIGDNRAYRWISSTVRHVVIHTVDPITGETNDLEVQYLCVVGTFDEITHYPYPTVNREFPAVSDTGDGTGMYMQIDRDANSGSVHPICRF